jgi:hypothetical protein
MTTANQTYFDLQLRYQHRLRQLASRILGRSIELVSLSDRQLLARLRNKLPPLRRGRFDLGARKYLALMDELKELRRKDIERAWNQAMGDVKEIAYVTQDKEEERVVAALPIRVPFGRITAAAILSTFKESFAGGPIDARTFPQWLDSIQAADFTRIQGAVQKGIQDKLTTEEIIKVLAGSARQGYSDGVLSQTRRNMLAVLGAGITHTHNSVSEKIWDRNADLFKMLQWVSVLDGRTSRICAARDGKFAPLGKNKVPAGLPLLDPPSARPPAHPNCRSIVVPVFDHKGIAGLVGERPFVRETTEDEFSRKDFRADARIRMGDNRWRTLSEVDRQKAVDALRDKWLVDRIGTVPADITYDGWLRTQPIAFQDEVLGRSKATLFRKGLSLDRFVDRTGRELTVQELKGLLE